MKYSHQCGMCGKVIYSDSKEPPAAMPCEYTPGSHQAIVAKMKDQRHWFFEAREVKPTKEETK